jgi:hypothetical protein
VSRTDRTPDGDEYAALRDPALTELSRSADAEAARVLVDARMRARSRRRIVTLGVLSIVVTAAVVGTGVTRFANRRHQSADVKIHSTAPPITVELISENPVPPAQGAPFPVTPVGDASVLRHSGGPYLSRSRVAAKVLAHLECKLGGARHNMPGFTCARVDVAYFDRYADAWQLRGARWAFVHAWGADREMYAVTVWGHLVSDVPPVGTKPSLTELTTVEIDATTGRTMMEGGPPLPAADANRRQPTSGDDASGP